MSKHYQPRSNIAKNIGGPLKKGDIVPWHKHAWAHDTFVLSGGLRFVGRGGEREEKYIEKWATDATPWVLIEAGREHMAEALEDGTRYVCVFAVRNIDGHVIESDDLADYAGSIS